ncbi:MAG: peptidylprolyl isomerase [Oscillospiraceae bacterium]|nr:peptidylprolyl isomerase [Oscillospiraceae bacterium]
MNMKKFLAAGLSAVMLLTMAACGADDAASSGEAAAVSADTVVMTIDGTEYTAKDYAAFINNARVEWNSYLSQYGMTEEDYIEMTGADVYGEDLRARAQNYMVLYEVLESKMEEFGLELTEEDTALNAVYASMGLDESYGAMQAMLMKVNDYCVGEGGTMRPSEDELMKFFHENYLRCKHVLISTVDDNYNPLENQDELKALAEDIAARAQAGEDFEALIEEYNEDPGMAANPDGYVFTEGTMVASFYEGTLALEDNAVSDPVESTYGWHIIKRLPLRDEDFASVEEEVLGLFVDFDSIVQEWANEMKVEIKAEASGIGYENAETYLK